MDKKLFREASGKTVPGLVPAEGPESCRACQRRVRFRLIPGVW